MNPTSVIKYLSHIMFVISEELIHRRVTMSEYDVGLPFKADEPTHVHK